MPNDAVTDATLDPARLVVYASGTGTEIRWYQIDGTTGALTQLDAVTAFASNPSFLAVAPNRNFLYAVAEGADRVGGYRIDPATGALTFLNDVAVGGNGPAHVAVDRSSRFVFVANYGDGTISVFPIGTDGTLGAAQQTITAGQNAHQILTDAANKFVFVPCLGSDYVAQYAFDETTGMLTPNAVPHLTTANNAGPRHLAFAPDGAHAFLINELNSTMTALAYDATLGRLSTINTVSTLETPVSGNSGAEIQVHGSGEFVYGSNRGDNSIVTMSIAPGGAITPLAWTSTAGSTPRHFSIAGDLLVVGNQGSDTIQPMVIGSTGVPAVLTGATAFPDPELTLIIPLPPL